MITCQCKRSNFHTQSLPETGVLLQSGNYSFDAMADMPADFGPDVPTEGISAPLWVRAV